MTHFKLHRGVTLLCCFIACSREPGPAPGAGSRETTAVALSAGSNHVPVHIDSFVPPAVALARFRAGLDSVTHFTGGAPSRGALVQMFVKALERNDSAALAGLVVSRAEFAYLYYPTAPEASLPYDLSPGLDWFLLQGNSRKGLLRALARRGGRPLGYLSYWCDPKPSRHGGNTVWGPCEVRHVGAQGDTISERLFTSIIERGGQFKFLSLANKF